MTVTEEASIHYFCTLAVHNDAAMVIKGVL